MRFETLCRYALKEGAKCKITDYGDFERRVANIKRARQNPNSVESIALSAGVHNFGRALHQTDLNTRRAASICKDIRRPVPSSTQQALLWLVGAGFVNYAYYWLSPIVRAIAPGWKELTAKEQLKILGTVSTELRKVLDAASLVESKESVEKYSLLRQMFIKRDTRQFLPAKFGELAIDEHQSCLGMSIMLTAFAARTGAKYMWVTPTLLKPGLEAEVKRGDLQRILTQYRGCSSRDRKFFSLIKRTVEQMNVGAMALDDWHHAVVIQISDGRWVLLDPYMCATCVLKNTEELNQAYRVLIQYGYLLPGLTLQVGDLNTSLEYVANVRLNTENILSAAMAFREDMEQDRYRTVEDLLSSLPMKILSWVSYFEHCKMKLDEVRPLRVETLAHWWRPNGTQLHKIDPAADEKKFNKSAEFRRESLMRLETQFYRYATSDIDTLSANWNVPHPAMEVHNPATAIGLAALSNLLSLDDGLTPSSDLVTLLVSHTNAQMLWHEAVVALNGAELKPRQQRIMDDARASIEAEPEQHQLCKVQLQS